MNDIPSELVHEGLNQENLEALQGFYSMQQIIKVSLETRGLINTTLHILSSGGKFTATFFRSKNNAQVASIAEIMSALEGLPIAKPIRGKNGYVFNINDIGTIVCPFVEGIHTVGEDHTEKTHINSEAHKNIAGLFWKLHRQLRRLSTLGENLPTSNYASIEDLLERIDQYFHTLGLSADCAAKITAFCERCQEGMTEDSKKDEENLVHSDFERQNIFLASNGKVNGIVDFDALKNGDLLYEFAHALYNFVCCDPEPNNRDIDIYLDSFVKIGILPTEGIKRIYSLMCRFCIEDISGFLEIAHRRPLNIQKLIKHYEDALVFAYNYFQS